VGQIEKNYRNILARIGAVASAAGRDPSSIKLVVVTKSHPVDAVREVVAAGAHCLGENYVEEALDKIKAFGDQEIEWRMIGHVQSRKARLVVENFAWCDSLDSLKLAKRLDRFAAETGVRLPVLLECNVSGEESKSGFTAWDENGWQALADELSAVVELPNLRIAGLMTMPPFFDEPERARPYFRRLRRLQGFLSKCFPDNDWKELSMGMSGDYKAAIQEGATLVRIGTAIMGPRN
jgi:pyridoxal phosphate enzyme (YggS family)